MRTRPAPDTAAPSPHDRLALLATRVRSHHLSVEIYPGRADRYVARAVAPGAHPYLVMTPSVDELAAILPGSPDGPGAAHRPQRWLAVLDGPRLRGLRRERGLSQAGLASLAGLSLTSVARLERQRAASCRTRTVARLAAALGEDPASLTTRPGPG